MISAKFQIKNFKVFLFHAEYGDVENYTNKLLLITHICMIVSLV